MDEKKGKQLIKLKQDIQKGEYNENIFEPTCFCNECVFFLNDFEPETRICTQFHHKIKENQVGCYGGYKWKKKN